MKEEKGRKKGRGYAVQVLPLARGAVMDTRLLTSSPYAEPSLGWISNDSPWKAIGAGCEICPTALFSFGLQGWADRTVNCGGLPRRSECPAFTRDMGVLQGTGGGRSSHRPRVHEWERGSRSCSVCVSAPPRKPKSRVSRWESTGGHALSPCPPSSNTYLPNLVPVKSTAGR